MKTDAVLQVRIDGQLKKEVENLYERLGISIADAVRLFVVQSLEMQGLPFDVKSGLTFHRTLHAFGIAKEYANPSLIPMEKDAWKKAVMKKYGNS